MIDTRPDAAAAARLPEAASALFQTQWELYRKVVDHNYLFHREAYRCLRGILLHEVNRPFRFLDVACGDAGASVGALRGTRVAAYHGIDLSQAALERAHRALEALACPVRLDQRDFAEALRELPEPVEVAWIGLSLHHFRTPEKLAVMREVRRLVGDQGTFVIYENTMPDGEDRDGWLRRWDRQKPSWTALTPDEWDAATAHVRANDFPEAASRWRALGRDAGFGLVEERFVAPTNLFRVYAFRA